MIYCFESTFKKVKFHFSVKNKIFIVSFLDLLHFVETEK